MTPTRSVALFANVCAYCGESRPLVRDHKVPLVRGGTNDITNIRAGYATGTGSVTILLAKQRFGDVVQGAYALKPGTALSPAWP